VVGLYKPDAFDISARNNPPFFYGISIRPSAIVEFEASDLENIKIFKVYKLDDPLDPLIGTFSMAANQQSIIHLLVNPETGNQYLRVYCRFSNYLSNSQY
jgi:hypothetical protein